MKQLIVLSALALAAGAARAQDPPAQEMKLAAAPAPVQTAVHADPDLAGAEVLGLEVQPVDLDHDGRAEWIVSASVEDRAGLRRVNRPAWVFASDGKEWRLVEALGSRVRVEPTGKPRHGAYDDLRVLTKEGPRLTCEVLSFQGGHYRRSACCDARTGAAAPCS